jgi:hypothetical protein
MTSAAEAILEAILYAEELDMNSDGQRILIGKILAIWEAVRG